MATMNERKPVHSIVLDAGPLLINQPPISTLLAQSEKIYTIPAVIAEIRDPVARARLDTTVMPFLTIRTPSPASMKTVSDFARRTGDLAVLSKPDLQVLALAYELECERNHGDWRLRKTPGQKGINGPPPKPEDISVESNVEEKQPTSQTIPEVLESTEAASEAIEAKGLGLAETEAKESIVYENKFDESKAEDTKVKESISEETHHIVELRNEEEVESKSRPDACMKADEPNLLENRSSASLTEQSNVKEMSALALDNTTEIEAVQGTPEEQDSASSPPALGSSESSSDFESDSEGWITPSNLKRHQQLENEKHTGPSNRKQSVLEVATLTTDFALQNTLLLMNLNLLSPSLSRISHLKSHILRCHACFATEKEMTRQFCQRCGKPTLTRVTCSTSANGEFKLYLKKNMQWNTRGDRYSVPKPVAGTSNGKLGKGGRGKGGKNAWGKELLLAEDQKEYTKALTSQAREKKKDLMDTDYLPGILTGERNGGSRIRVGAGRTVNSKKR